MWRILLLSILVGGCSSSGEPTSVEAKEHTDPSTAKAAPPKPLSGVSTDTATKTTDTETKTTDTETKTTDTETKTTDTEIPQSAPVAVTPGTIRVVLFAEHTLLRSESKSLKSLMKSLGTNAALITAPDATELKYRDQLGSDALVIPDTWKTTEKIVMLELNAPSVKASGKQVSGGVVQISVILPPEIRPVYQDKSSFAPKPITTIVKTLTLAEKK